MITFHSQSQRELYEGFHAKPQHASSSSVTFSPVFSSSPTYKSTYIPPQPLTTTTTNHVSSASSSSTPVHLNCMHEKNQMLQRSVVDKQQTCSHCIVLTKQNECFKNKISSLQTNIAELRKQLENSKQAHQKTIDENKKQNKDLVTDKDKKITENKLKIDELNKQLNKRDQDCLQLKKTISTLQQEQQQQHQEHFIITKISTSKSHTMPAIVLNSIHNNNNNNNNNGELSRKRKVMSYKKNKTDHDDDDKTDSDDGELKRSKLSL